MAKILHLLDPSTPEDAFDILAHLLTLPHSHHIAAIGHHSTATLAKNAGIDPKKITWLPSIGALDPTAWRALKKLLQKLQPTHLHAWGTSATLAASMAKFPVTRIATFADLPAHPKLLALLPNSKTTFTATDPTIADALPNNPLLIPPGIPHSHPKNAAQTRASLGLAPTDFPVILAGGDGGGSGKNARQDLAIWIAAILHQLFPHTRLILRQNPRTLAVPGLDRFGFDLADERLVIAAPHHLSWQKLLPAADVLLITATAPIPTASMLYAMAAKVPIVATPIPSVTELLTHNRSALIAKHAGIGIAPPVGRNTIRPRSIAAELERLLTTPALAQSLATNAHRHVSANFPLSAMLTAFEELYENQPEPQPLKSADSVGAGQCA